VTLMALSNKWRALVLTTGNKSELAVGYCTLYGDMCGGLAVISDVPKTLVYDLSRVANRRHPGAIPESVFTKAPSAELRPNQKDSDSLPVYEVLDRILHAVSKSMNRCRASPPSRTCPSNWCATLSTKWTATNTNGSRPRPDMKVTTKALGWAAGFHCAEVLG
jgi:NAD+ synthase/NAD+ synthase (glutamine-hydrolysing)